MIKKLLILLIVCQSFSVFGQKKIWEETPAQKKERMQWWTDARFGMFIHFGLYSQAARHEWVMRKEKMSVEEYEKYFELFNPDLYDPKVWAKKAKAAGMKYAVITTKHHEGFTLFDSEYTDYKITNTPYGKDAIQEGLKVGFYYSLLDWHHPEYTIDRNHPLSPENEEDYAKLNKGRDMDIYREYLKNHVREILTKYGKIDLLWLDYSFPNPHGKFAEDWDSAGLMKMVRELQPEIIVNDRADLKEYEGGWDFTTPEQFTVEKWLEYNGERVAWETCQTFSGSWGYYRDEYTWKNKRQLLTLLIESVSKGGNVLLNVGPTGRGAFDPRVDKALAEMGEWMAYNSRSIYECTQAPEGFTAPPNTVLTYNPKSKRLYLHLLNYPTKNLLLKNFKDKIKYAQFLHDASEIELTEPYSHWMIKQEFGENDINLVLPVTKPDIEIPVIELFLK